jgi:hypothetical protein
MLLIMCLFFLTSAFSPKKYGIGENCIIINSIKFGKILMKTIGEDRVRDLIRKNKGIGLGLELDTLGYVQRVIRFMGSKELNAKDRNLIKKNILHNFFYVCYADEFNDDSLLADRINTLIKEDHSLFTGAFFPGPLSLEYMRNKEDYLSKGVDESDYIISRLKN